MTGIIENFQVQQIDSSLSAQLISLLKKETDFELVFGGMTIFVHKFILAARSPVFAAKFEASRELKQERIE